MAKRQKTDIELVTEHIQKLPAELAGTVEYLRKKILSVDKEVGEKIKWNNPAFYYTGDMAPFDPKEYKREIIVMNLYKGRIMLVMPSGAKLKVNTALLEGDYKDGRRLIIFADLADVKLKENELAKVVREWISLVEK